MREFFKGWRRKVGCVALVMVCGTTTLWVRSLHVKDIVEFRTGPKTWEHWACVDGVVARWAMNNGPFMPKQPKWIRLARKPIRPGDSEEVKYDWKWNGLGVGKSTSDERNIVWKVPLWLVACPLTLLSAYLILWKPRKKKSKLPCAFVDSPPNRLECGWVAGVDQREPPDQCSLVLSSANLRGSDQLAMQPEWNRHTKPRSTISNLVGGWLAPFCPRVHSECRENHPMTFDIPRFDHALDITAWLPKILQKTQKANVTR